MVRAKQAAEEAARKAIESTYIGVATVIEHQKKRDPVTKLTAYEEVVVLDEVPCKLSFESVVPVTQSESVGSVAQTIKLFLSPDIRIKPGSKITITQTGITTDYTHSGIPAIYPTHQEIVLELFERWA